MDADRLSTGEKISAASAILLFIFMFFNWFGVEVSGVPGLGTVSGGDGGNAWDVLDVIPIFLLIAVVAALAVAVIRLTEADVEPPISMNAVVAALGGLAVLLILYRIINQPDVGGVPEGIDVNVTLKIGIWLGLIAAAGIAYGGYSAMREEGLTFGEVAEGLSTGSGEGQPPAGGAAPPPPEQQPPSPPASQTPPPPPPQNPPPPTGGV